ncbi:MAG TPA: peptidase M61, partial [Castellaniella sp.]|nr:peptidase M61 [Castellaniella sp.]
NEMSSLGLALSQAGMVKDVLWQGPAFKAGLAPHLRLLSVDGHAYSTVALRAAIVQAQHSKQPIQIRAEGDGVTKLYAVDYHAGLKYPHLVRVPGTTDYLKEVLAPRSPANGS